MSKRIKENSKLTLYTAIGLGGMIGAILRYSVSVLFFAENEAVFPWATLFVNLTGAFLLTFLLFQPFIRSKFPPLLFTALTTGVIGSYTTFSMIVVEIVSIWNISVFITISYVFCTIFGGLLSSFSGYKLAMMKERISC